MPDTGLLTDGIGSCHHGSVAIRARYDGLQRAGEGDRYLWVRLLWLKVIARAIFDYVLYQDSNILERHKDAEQAKAWLFEPSKLFNSLENVCNFLGYPPQIFRYRALTMTKDDVRKIEHMERMSDSYIAPVTTKEIDNLDSPYLLEISESDDEDE